MQKKQTNKLSPTTIIILCVIAVILFFSFKNLYPGLYESTFQPDKEENPLNTDTDSNEAGGYHADDNNTGGYIDESSAGQITYNPGDVDVNYLKEELSFLQNPLPGTVMSWKDAHLPGAKRPYRSGIHHGLDFYGQESGGGIKLGTRVLSAAPGTVIRIDDDYTLPSMQKLTQLGEKCRELGETPEDILDIFRGRQVWIEHEKGFVIRYCHLDEVSESLQNGHYVEAGDKIGTMGYSGTTEPNRPHLHMEIWFDDHYLGEGMTVKEIRRFFQATIFDNQSS